MLSLGQMKLLVNLARVDGTVAARERSYLMNIGKANGFSDRNIAELIDKEHELIVPDGLSGEEQFEFLYRLVQLMKVDERMYQEEIRFCSFIASKLGYNPQVMFDLMLHVDSSDLTEKKMKDLRQLTQKFKEK